MNGEDNIGRKIKERLENHESLVSGKLWETLQQSLPTAPPAGAAPATPPAPVPPASLVSPFIKLIYTLTTAGLIAVSSKVAITDYSAANQSVPKAAIAQAPSFPTPADSAVAATTADVFSVDSAPSVEKAIPSDTDSPVASSTEKITLPDEKDGLRTATSPKRPLIADDIGIDAQRNQLQPTLENQNTVADNARSGSNHSASQKVEELNKTVKQRKQSASFRSRTAFSNEPSIGYVLDSKTSARKKDESQASDKIIQTPLAADKQVTTHATEVAKEIVRPKIARNQDSTSAPKADTTTKLSINLPVNAQSDALRTDSTLITQSTGQPAIEPVKPAEQARGKGRFLVEGVFTVGVWSGPSYKTDSSKNVYTALNGSSTGIGLRGKYQIAPQLLLGTGALLEKMQLHNEYQFRQSTTEMYYQYNYGWQLSPMGGRDSVYTIVDSVAKYQTKSVQVTAREKLTFSYLAVPLTFTYQRHKNRFDYYGSAGVQINILLNSRHHLSSLDTSATVTESGISTRPNRVVAVATGSLGISYQLWRNLSVMVEPRFQYTLSPVYQPRSFGPQRLHSLGVTTGIRLTF